MNHPGKGTKIPIYGLFKGKKDDVIRTKLHDPTQTVAISGLRQVFLTQRKPYPEVTKGIFGNFTANQAKKKGLSSTEDPFKIVFCPEAPAFWEHNL